MRKIEELRDLASCLNRAEDDELVFVLLGRDIAAPDTIRGWARERIAMGKNKPGDAQIREAMQCARRMEEYQALRETARRR